MDVTLLAFLPVLAGSPRAQPAASCYRYDADSVALAGRVERRVYPGRPNYESTKRGDEPDTVFVLRLARPLCVATSSDHEGHRGIREVQLYYSAEDAAAIRALRGKSTLMKGTLLAAAWGWHHLPVLLHVRLPRIRASSSRAA